MEAKFFTHSDCTEELIQITLHWIMIPSIILDVDFRNVNKYFVAQLLGVLKLYATAGKSQTKEQQNCFFLRET